MNENYSTEGAWAGIDHNSRYVEMSMTPGHWHHLILQDFISSSQYEQYRDSLYIYLNRTQKMNAYHIRFIHQDSLHLKNQGEFYRLVRIPHGISAELTPQNRDVLAPVVSRMFQVHKKQLGFKDITDTEPINTEIPDDLILMDK